MKLLAGVLAWSVYGDGLGAAVAALGDLDGHGPGDVAATAPGDGDGGSYGVSARGAVWVLFLDAQGSLRTHQKISVAQAGFTGALDPGDSFGSALAGLGDLDGDGVEDLAVGAYGDDGSNFGAVWILFLRPDGTVKAHQKISATARGFGGELAFGDSLGGSLAAVGDLDGDGRSELAVGNSTDYDGRSAGPCGSCTWRPTAPSRRSRRSARPREASRGTSTTTTTSAVTWRLSAIWTGTAWRIWRRSRSATTTAWWTRIRSAAPRPCGCCS